MISPSSAPRQRLQLLLCLAAVVTAATACSDDRREMKLPTEIAAAAPAAAPRVSRSVDVRDQVNDLVTRVLPSFEEKSAESLQQHLETLSRAALAGDHGSARLALSAARSDLRPDAASPVDLGAVEATLDVIERDLTSAE
jgi:hypothetical protein